MRLGKINSSYPLNWAHPQARGLISCWKTLPHWRGGTIWRNLCGRIHSTITNASTPTAWSGDTYRGGFGSIALDGSDDFVNVTDGFTRTLSGLVQFSVTLWVKGNSFTNSPLIYCAPHATGDYGFPERNLPERHFYAATEAGLDKCGEIIGDAGLEKLLAGGGG